MKVEAVAVVEENEENNSHNDKEEKGDGNGKMETGLQQESDKLKNREGDDQEQKKKEISKNPENSILEEEQKEGDEEEDEEEEAEEISVDGENSNSDKRETSDYENNESETGEENELILIPESEALNFDAKLRKYIQKIDLSEKIDDDDDSERDTYISDLYYLIATVQGRCSYKYKALPTEFTYSSEEQNRQCNVTLVFEYQGSIEKIPLSKVDYKFLKSELTKIESSEASELKNSEPKVQAQKPKKPKKPRHKYGFARLRSENFDQDGNALGPEQKQHVNGSNSTKKSKPESSFWISAHWWQHVYAPVPFIAAAVIEGMFLADKFFVNQLPSQLWIVFIGGSIGAIFMGCASWAQRKYADNLPEGTKKPGFIATCLAFALVGPPLAAEFVPVLINSFSIICPDLGQHYWGLFAGFVVFTALIGALGQTLADRKGLDYHNVMSRGAPLLIGAFLTSTLLGVPLAIELMPTLVEMASHAEFLKNQSNPLALPGEILTAMVIVSAVFGALATWGVCRINEAMGNHYALFPYPKGKEQSMTCAENAMCTSGPATYKAS